MAPGVERGAKRSKSIVAPTMRSLRSGMPAARNVSTLCCEGTQISSRSSRRGTHAEGIESVSNIVRATFTAPSTTFSVAPGM